MLKNTVSFSLGRFVPSLIRFNINPESTRNLKTSGLNGCYPLTGGPKTSKKDRPSVAHLRGL